MSTTRSTWYKYCKLIYLPNNVVNSTMVALQVYNPKLLYKSVLGLCKAHTWTDVTTSILSKFVLIFAQHTMDQHHRLLQNGTPSGQPCGLPGHAPCHHAHVYGTICSQETNVWSHEGFSIFALSQHCFNWFLSDSIDDTNKTFIWTALI